MRNLPLATLALALASMFPPLHGQGAILPEIARLELVSVQPITGPGLPLVLEVTGPPNLHFDLFATTSLQVVPWVPFLSGNTGPSGLMQLPFVLPPGVIVPQVWLAGLGWMPGNLPGLVAPAAFGLGCAPPAPATWTRAGTLKYVPPTPGSPGMFEGDAIGCPGETFEVIRNGVVILSGTIPSGLTLQFQTAAAGFGAGQTVELRVGGVLVAGPIGG